MAAHHRHHLQAAPASPRWDHDHDVAGDEHPWDDDYEHGPWACHDLDRTAFPSTDDDTAMLIRDAVKTLTLWRRPDLGDAGATVSALVSLAGEAESQLWDAVADARDHDYTWDQIADRLATSATTARRRYSAYTKWRKTQPPDND